MRGRAALRRGKCNIADAPEAVEEAGGETFLSRCDMGMRRAASTGTSGNHHRPVNREDQSR